MFVGTKERVSGCSGSRSVQCVGSYLCIRLLCGRKTVPCRSRPRRTELQKIPKVVSVLAWKQWGLKRKFLWLLDKRPYILWVKNRLTFDFQNGHGSGCLHTIHLRVSSGASMEWRNREQFYHKNSTFHLALVFRGRGCVLYSLSFAINLETDSPNTAILLFLGNKYSILMMVTYAL